MLSGILNKGTVCLCMSARNHAQTRYTSLALARFKELCSKAALLLMHEHMKYNHAYYATLHQNDT